MNIKAGKIQGVNGDAIYNEQGNANINVSAGEIIGGISAIATGGEGTIQITGGTITGGTGSGIYISGNMTTTVTGGDIAGTLGIELAGNANVTIENGNISGKEVGIRTFDGTLEIKGGKIIGNVYDAISAYKEGTIKVSGGELTGNNSGIYIQDTATGTITVENGIINGKQYYGIYNNSSAIVDIYGGTITGGTSQYGGNGTINVH